MIKESILALDSSQPCGSLLTASIEHEITDGNFQSIITSNINNYSYDKIILGIGPGRVTGVRTSASFISAYAYIKNIPVYTISSLLVLAQRASLEKKQEKIIVAINARLSEYFIAEYHFKKEITIIKEPHISNSYPEDTNCSFGIPALGCNYKDWKWLPALQEIKLWEKSNLLIKQEQNNIIIPYLRSGTR